MGELAGAVTTLARAARAAGVTHLRLRRGPVAEMVLLPEDPPTAGGPPDKDARELAAEAKAARDRALFGGGS